MSKKLHLRHAEVNDYRVLHELLENNHLPSIDIDAPSIEFILGVIDERVVACAALEKTLRYLFTAFGGGQRSASGTGVCQFAV